MVFRKCTEDYLKIKKEQYLDVANFVLETINKAQLEESEESFNFIKLHRQQVVESRNYNRGI